MKQYKLALAFLWRFLLASCASQPTPLLTSTPVENTPIPAPQPTPTQTLAPQPTATTQPTIVPYVPVDGPHLAYFREADGKRELVLMSPDGKAHKTISLPPEIADFWSINWIELRFLSPDGNWLAFYTGSAGDLYDPAPSGKFDLALNLMNIKTGETYLLAHLLSKDYPKNFEAAAKQLGRSDVTAQSLQFAFLNGIQQSIAWSPDGRYLAFAGQMEGLSSDLYLYDTRYGTIKRLSSGPEELQWIRWSTDGKWIVHGSAYEAGMGMMFNLYVSNLAGTDVRHLATASIGEIEAWLNPHTFFLHESENGPGDFGLRLIDVTSGEVTKIWDGAYHSFSFEEGGKRILIFPFTPDKWPYDGHDPNFVSGNYMVDLSTGKKTLIVKADNDHFYMETGYFGLGERIFWLINSSSDIVNFLTEDGKLVETKFQGAEISVSSRKNFWLLRDEKALKIFTADDQLVQEIPLPALSVKRYSILWRPDESGLFIIADREIYALDLHSENFMLVETKLIKEFTSSEHCKWVGGK